MLWWRRRSTCLEAQERRQAAAGRGEPLAVAAVHNKNHARFFLAAGVSLDSFHPQLR